MQFTKNEILYNTVIKFITSFFEAEPLTNESNNKN